MAGKLYCNSGDWLLMAGADPRLASSDPHHAISAPGITGLSEVYVNLHIASACAFINT